MVQQALDEYFERLLLLWESRFGSLPQMPLVDGADPSFYVSRVDGADLAYWRPVERVTSPSFLPIERDIGFVHPSIKEYFGSFYFHTVGGRYRGRRIELFSSLPGIELAEFQTLLRSYLPAHRGATATIPMGFETQEDLLVVVDNRDGSVLLEDADLGTFTPFAPSLQELVSGLEL